MKRQLAALKVLIVDDDLVDRERVRRLLSKSSLHCQITEARTVNEGLELYDENAFDVILLDYRMPCRSGVEMILELRTQMRKYGSAIVMMSTSEDEKLVIECLKAGAQDFIAKSEITGDRIQKAIVHAQTRFELDQALRARYLTSKKLAERDSLTGLANRFAFEEALMVAIANNGRCQHKLGLILFDIDDFKHVNDTHGHDVGDEVLKEIAVRITAVLRGNELFSRLGGDEFVIMITNVKEIMQFSEIAKRIITAVEPPFLIHQLRLQINISLGIAIHPDNSSDSKELLKCSDIALYRAKQTKGSQFCFFYADMQTQYLRRYEIEKILASAIAEDKLMLLYQPIINPDTMQWTGFEALLRLRSFSDSLILPDEFIPVAERSGAIITIGAWVIEHAMKQLKLWREKLNKTLTMSINLSGAQLESNDLLDVICCYLKELDIPPSSIEFEITESVFLQANEFITNQISNIRALGCRIALGDFGSGHSSISSLQSFPISSVKLDKSIMPVSIDDQNGMILVEALITLANKFNLDKVAEGLEQEFQLQFITQHPVSRVQGFLFSKPITTIEVEQSYFCSTAVKSNNPELLY